MNKVTINVKDNQGVIVKSYDMELVDESVVDIYEEARRVWCEYHVECIAGPATLSSEYTYEQEMLMHTEHEQYKMFLMTQVEE